MQQLQFCLGDVLAGIESFAIGGVNIAFELFLFNNCSQQSLESFECFHNNLHQLVKSFAYCDRCVDSIVQGHLVLGVREKDIQQGLLKVWYLTLLKLKVVDICIVAENSESHWRTMNMEPPAVESIHALPKSQSHPRTEKSPPTHPPPRSATCKFY